MLRRFEYRNRDEISLLLSAADVLTLLGQPNLRLLLALMKNADWVVNPLAVGRFQMPFVSRIFSPMLVTPSFDDTVGLPWCMRAMALTIAKPKP